MLSMWLRIKLALDFNSTHSRRLSSGSSSIIDVRYAQTNNDKKKTLKKKQYNLMIKQYAREYARSNSTENVKVIKKKSRVSDLHVQKNQG